MNLTVRITPAPPVPPSPVPLYQLGLAPNPRYAAQTLNSAPDVWIFSTGLGRVDLSEAWQWYIRDLNYNMIIDHVSALFGNDKAFTNGTGFPGHANYLKQEELDKGLPQFDKDRSTSLACHTGVMEGDMLRVTTLDGNKPPPEITDVNPYTHPWLFFHATVVYRGGSIGAFPNAAPGWGISRNCVWMPLVATHPIYVAISDVTPVSEYRLPYTL